VSARRRASPRAGPAPAPRPPLTSLSLLLLLLRRRCHPPAGWRADAAFDASLRPFLALTDALVAGAPPPAEPELSADEAAVAEVLACDQVPRNCWRGSARAFEGDAFALRRAREAVAAGALERLPRDNEQPRRLFLLMPFMHAEDPAAHAEAEGLWPAANEGFARDHAAVVRRFARFPHRNKVLGRASTPEEEAHLASPERESWES
jgi:hypothetical protein